MNLVPFGRENGAPARRDLGFNTLQREIDRVFDSFARNIPVWGGHSTAASNWAYPNIDVVESDKEIEITCELPGMEESDVNLSLADGVLTIKGEKQATKEEKGKSYQLLERTYGSFSRSIPLPTNLEVDSVRASMDKGLLKVKVAKPKSAAPHQIEIKHAN
jgi:HSP20 family protein